MDMQREFEILAVGNKKYYKLTTNLLNSYRFHTKALMLFAIIADRHNKYTEFFAEVLVSKSPTYSY